MRRLIFKRISTCRTTLNSLTQRSVRVTTVIMPKTIEKMILITLITEAPWSSMTHSMVVEATTKTMNTKLTTASSLTTIGSIISTDQIPDSKQLNTKSSCLTVSKTSAVRDRR